MTNVQKIKAIVGANMREKLWAAAASAEYTKAEIKEAFEISDASFSSQASYLRWTGKHIVVEANGIVRQGSNEDFEKYQKSRLERKTAVPKPKDLEKQKTHTLKRIAALATALGYEVSEEVEAALSESLTETDILEAKLTIEKARLAALTKELASLSDESDGDDENDESDGNDDDNSESDGDDENDESDGNDDDNSESAGNDDDNELV